MPKPLKSTDDSILEALSKEKGFVSGEALARSLRISRQALWKHISHAIELGYTIEAVPHLGYKLVSVPDKLYPALVRQGLKTSFIAKEIRHFDTVESTQTIAWSLGLSGAREGLVVFAESQKKGRGRMQRTWISPRGGIYFSLLLRPDFLTAEEAPQIALLIALGCIRGIEKVIALRCQVKWPNDIYFENKKLGGILCEINAEIDRVHFLVAGIGINVNSRDLPSGATSLFRVTQKTFARAAIVRGILEEIEACYLKAAQIGFSPILQEWQQHCMLWGKRITVKVFDSVVEGEAMGIDEKGFLRLRRDNGLTERISSGDIIKVNVS